MAFHSCLIPASEGQRHDIEQHLLDGTHVHMRTPVNVENNGIARMPTLAAAWAALLVDAGVGDVDGGDCSGLLASAQSPSPGWQSGPVVGQAAPDPLCAAFSLHVGFKRRAN